MSEEKKFITGLFTSRRENAPDFVLANLSFKTEQFIEWLKENTNAKGYVNVDLLSSKDGKPYAKLNEWKPTESFVKNEDGSIGVEVQDDTPQDFPF
jgi:hypothetical protein